MHVVLAQPGVFDCVAGYLGGRLCAALVLRPVCRALAAAIPPPPKTKFEDALVDQTEAWAIDALRAAAGPTVRFDYTFYLLVRHRHVRVLESYVDDMESGRAAFGVMGYDVAHAISEKCDIDRVERYARRLLRATDMPGSLWGMQEHCGGRPAVWARLQRLIYEHNVECGYEKCGPGKYCEYLEVMYSRFDKFMGAVHKEFSKK